MIVLAAVSLASCSDSDGDWEPMKWSKSDYKVVLEDGTKYYYVPQEGAVFSFTCKNYMPWISGMSVTAGETFAHVYPFDDDLRLLEYETVRVNVTDYLLTVRFAPAPVRPDDNRIHRYALTLTAGDVFHTFRFMQ